MFLNQSQIMVGIGILDLPKSIVGETNRLQKMIKK